MLTFYKIERVRSLDEFELRLAVTNLNADEAPCTGTGTYRRYARQRP